MAREHFMHLQFSSAECKYIFQGKVYFKSSISINFLGGFIEGISMVNFLGQFLHLFLVVGKQLLKLSTMSKMQIAVARATQLCRPNMRAL